MWFAQSCSNLNFVVIYAIFPPNRNFHIFRIENRLLQLWFRTNKIFFFKPKKCLTPGTSPLKKTSWESQNAALRTSHRLSMCQVVLGWFHVKSPRKTWQIFFWFLTLKVKSIRYFSDKNYFFDKFCGFLTIF